MAMSTLRKPVAHEARRSPALRAPLAAESVVPRLLSIAERGDGKPSGSAMEAREKTGYF